jgi:hypothetical protein
MSYYQVVHSDSEGWGWHTSARVPASIRRIVSNLNQMKRNIQAAVDGLDEELLWKRIGPDVSSIGNLLMHLRGTEHQWLGHKVGGRPLKRDRDDEFARREGLTLGELIAALKRAWKDTEEILEDLTEEKIRSHRSEDGLSIPFMLHYSAQHLALHCGQIVTVREFLEPGFRLYSPKD